MKATLGYRSQAAAIRALNRRGLTPKQIAEACLCTRNIVHRVLVGIPKNIPARNYPKVRAQASPAYDGDASQQQRWRNYARLVEGAKVARLAK